MSATLARRQEWLFAAITAADAPSRIGSILGGTAVDPAIGLEVYRFGYRARLRDCVIDDFPAVQHVIGEAAFAALADRYITDEPPRDATLNAYSSRFPQWLRTTAERVPQRAHLVQLAALEWALVEALHAPTAPAIAKSALARLAPEVWPTTRLRVAPSLRIVPCTWAVNASYQTYRLQRPPTPAVRQRGAVVIVRRPAGLRRLELDHDECRLLQRLAGGLPLGRALAGVPAERSGMIQTAFARWLAHGLFIGLA